MKISLKNISKVKEACIEIDGITVIAGENDTGKSTVGKTLFAVFNSLFNIEQQILSERIDSVENALGLGYRNASYAVRSRIDTVELARNLVNNIDEYKTSKEKLKEKVLENLAQYNEKIAFSDNESIDDVINRIYESINVSEEAIFHSVVENRLGAEFNGQINNIFSEEQGEIELVIKDMAFKILLQDHSVTVIENKLNLLTEAIYIDDPFVIDEVRPTYSYSLSGMNRNYDHRNHLKRKLNLREKNVNLVEEIVATKKFESIFNKVESVCNGDIIRKRPYSFGYKIPGKDQAIDARNLSTGLKTFVILKKLLIDGVIEQNGTIILDEPEIHLHPEWQLLFAELIVLIQKEFGTHILLTTHSPYFLRAIQVYASKYELSDKCKYYLANNLNDTSEISDVSDNINDIYKKLARPFQALEDEEWSDE